MKRKILLAISALAAAFIAYAALEPSAITIAVTFTGTPSPSDVRTAKWIIKKENERRASLVPPGVPLPSVTPADIKSSVLICFGRILTNYMIDNAAIADAEAAVPLTADEIRDIQRAITDQINAGLTPAQVLARIKP